MNEIMNARKEKEDFINKMDDIKKWAFQFVDDIANRLGVELKALVWIAFAFGVFLGRFIS